MSHNADYVCDLVSELVNRALGVDGAEFEDWHAAQLLLLLPEVRPSVALDALRAALRYELIRRARRELEDLAETMAQDYYAAPESAAAGPDGLRGLTLDYAGGSDACPAWSGLSRVEQRWLGRELEVPEP